MDGIFISYRRDDSAGYAGRIYDRLAAHFGEARVFMDVEGIEPGLDFVEAIEQAIASCRVLIVIIGDEWVTASDAAGRRRLDDPHDFIRLETGTALRRDIRVVPVLVGGAVMPRADELPEDLRPLIRRQAIEISHKQWEASTGELIRTLERIVGGAASPAAVKAQAPAWAGAAAAGPPGGAKRVPRAAMAAGVGVVLAAGAAWWLIGRETSPPDANGADRPVAIAERATRATAAEAVPGAADAGPAVPSAPGATPPAAAAPPATPPATPSTTALAAPAEPAAAPSAPAPAAPTPAAPPAPAAAPTPAAAPAPVAAISKPAPEPSRAAPTPAAPAAARAPAPPRSTPAAATPRPPARAAEPARAPAVREAPVAVLAPETERRQPAGEAPGRQADAALPVAGERWVYRSRGKWPTSPQRSFEIVARSVDAGVIVDAFRPIEPDSRTAGELRRSRAGRPEFVVWTEIGTEFSPYFGGFVERADRQTLRGLATPDVGSYWTQWHSEATIRGPEAVSVPAGNFQAVKVEVWSSRRATGSVAEAQLEPVRIHYLVWYVPEIKRYVKMQRRIISATNSENEKDVFELVAYRRP